MVRGGSLDEWVGLVIGPSYGSIGASGPGAAGPVELQHGFVDLQRRVPWWQPREQEMMAGRSDFSRKGVPLLCDVTKFHGRML